MQADKQAGLEDAERVMRRNASYLSQVGPVQDWGRPLILNMRNLAAEAAAAAASAGRGPVPVLARAAMESSPDEADWGNPMLRCAIM